MGLDHSQPVLHCVTFWFRVNFSVPGYYSSYYSLYYADRRDAGVDIVKKKEPDFNDATASGAAA